MASLPSRLRIATIERDSGFLRTLADCFRRIEWTLIVHPGPVTAMALLGGNPHAVLVDIGMLGPRWDEWLARQPARIPQLGVLVCSERSTVTQRVRGLHIGADDWITKPCHPDEVVARLQAIVRGHRMQQSGEEQAPLRGGELELCPELFEALVEGQPAGLTGREFEILFYLARRRAQVVERE
ncbi:MAG TPA: response regulator transcription factor, partial [Solirubrobacteraceae bacterium]|nr:response regulator transcription factor [Solirubrobacteraceae bacterium]